MIVKGIARWAKLNNQNYDKKYNRWTIDLYMDITEANKLKEAGLKPKKMEDGQWFFKFKRDRIRKKDGVAKVPPVLRDIANNDFDGLVGNGSEVRVQFTPIKYTEFGGGITHDLQGVQIIELIEYGGSDGSEFEPLGETPDYNTTGYTGEDEATTSGPEDDVSTEENPFV